MLIKLYQFLEYCQNSGIMLSTIITLISIYIKMYKEEKKRREQYEKKRKELEAIYNKLFQKK